MTLVVLSAEVTKGRGMMSTCVHVRSTGKECALKFTLDGHTRYLMHRRCTPEKTCEVCEDWSKEKWALFHLRIGETRQRAMRERERRYRV